MRSVDRQIMDNTYNGVFYNCISHEVDNEIMSMVKDNLQQGVWDVLVRVSDAIVEGMHVYRRK